MSDCQSLLTIASYFENFSRKMSEDVCRMCLEKGSKSSFISLNVGQPSFKAKLAACIPEMNLDFIQDPVICCSCSSALENAYQFKIKCLRSEEKLVSYIHNIMSVKPMATPLKLINVLPTSEFAHHEEIMVEPNFNYYHHQSDNRNQNGTYQMLGGTLTKADNPAIIKGASPQDGDVYICTTCKQSFLTKEELHSHILNHLGTRPYMCTYCYKCFTLKSNLQIHTRTHTQQRPFSCEYCQKSFTTKGNLKTHVRVHTKEKPYVCQICDKCFIQKVQLNTHMLLHDNAQIFSCEICEKSFTTKGTLQIHKRIHEDIKPFVCEYCDKSFTTNGNLNIHIRKHTGEKPYSCVECGKCFTQHGQLKIHKKTHANALESVEEHSVEYIDKIEVVEETLVVDK